MCCYFLVIWPSNTDQVEWGWLVMGFNVLLTICFSTWLSESLLGGETSRHAESYCLYMKLWSHKRLLLLCLFHCHCWTMFSVECLVLFYHLWVNNLGSGGVCETVERKSWLCFIRFLWYLILSYFMSGKIFVLKCKGAQLDSLKRTDGKNQLTIHMHCIFTLWFPWFIFRSFLMSAFCFRLSRTVIGLHLYMCDS